MLYKLGRDQRVSHLRYPNNARCRDIPLMVACSSGTNGQCDTIVSHKSYLSRSEYWRSGKEKAEMLSYPASD